MRELDVGETAVKVLPIEIIKDIREDLVQLYTHYLKAESESTFSKMSLHELQEGVKDEGKEAVEYPKKSLESVTKPVEYASRLYQQLVKILIILLIVTSIIGFSSVSVLLRQTVRSIDFTSIILYLIAVTSNLGSFVILMVLLLPILVSKTTIIAEAINKELVFIAEAETRDRDRLAGYYVWNSSLNGGKGLHILTIFLFLKLLSITRYDPYRYILNSVESNREEIEDSSGYREAIKRIYVNMQKDEDEDERDDD